MTPDITWFTPSVGVTCTELCFIQLSTKTTVLICALSCRSLQVLKATHTAADFLNHPKPSAHTTTEVVHAHSWDLTFSYKIALASHQFILHQKPNLALLQKCVFIQVHLLQNHGFKPWAPQNVNPGLNPWVNYKKRALTQPRHP